MERKPYSAGAVKFSFWFMEFRKTVQLLSEGKSFADIKKLNEETNIYGAPTKLRAQQIYSTVTARIKTLDESFYPIFLSSDLATQKLFVLTAALLHDTLFFDFVYEVVREKMILGSDELTDADIRIFFKNKQEQSEKVASLQDYKYSGEENSFVKEYIAQLKSESVSVGVITNHNKFDEGEYKALKKSGRKEGILILPDVELSVKEANGIHTLIAMPGASALGEKNHGSADISGW